jgi:maleamate amidohydrolase
MDSVREFYLSKGFGGRVGFGSSPAIIVIDMAKAWLDGSSPLGSRNVQGVMEHILRILKVGRERKVPIFFTTMVFDAGGVEAAGPIGRKLLHTSQAHSLDRGTDATVLDPRLERGRDEILIEKQRASAFWGTPLDSYLIGRRIDTLIITGCSTSGCIRGTAEAAHNANYHTIVVSDAVGDRHPLAHECNLTDIDMRYGDVVSADDVIAYLHSWKAS